MDEEPGL